MRTRVHGFASAALLLHLPGFSRALLMSTGRPRGVRSLTRNSSGWSGSLPSSTSSLRWSVVAKPKRDVIRVGATVPAHVVEVWRRAAEVQNVSFSALLAEWMTELAPGLVDMIRLHEAFEAADEAQREALRARVLAAHDDAQETLLGAWKPMQDIVRDAEVGK